MNLEDLESSVITVKGNAGCSMGKLLVSLPDDERARLRAVVEDPATSAPKLAQFLTSRGEAVTANVINTHRAGGCGCGKVGWR